MYSCTHGRSHMTALLVSLLFGTTQRDPSSPKQHTTRRCHARKKKKGKAAVMCDGDRNVYPCPRLEHKSTQRSLVQILGGRPTKYKQRWSTPAGRLASMMARQARTSVRGQSAVRARPPFRTNQWPARNRPPWRPNLPRFDKQTGMTPDRTGNAMAHEQLASSTGSPI